MKVFLIFCLLLVKLNLYSQSDSITVHKDLLLNASTRIQNLEKDLGFKTLQTDNLQKQVDALTRLNTYNETIIEYRNKEIEIYKGAVNRFVDFPTKTKDKWYETRQFSFFGGILIGGITIFSGAYVVSLIR
jgi:hypothetical protein